MKKLNLKNQIFSTFLAVGLIPLALMVIYFYQQDSKQFFSTTFIASVSVTIFGAIFFSHWYAEKIAQQFARLSSGLKQEAAIVAKNSMIVAEVSSKLSESTTQQAASLQETVASIDEISAMIQRNADSAMSSAKSSENSTKTAQEGKEKVELMLESIHSISQNNSDMIEKMEKSNKDISDIVKLIQEISHKTQVINDIVFQTKLLSFNASIEAARAGEHGKGFAVVAEEVGNLASMSGKAAKEISEMPRRRHLHRSLPSPPLRHSHPIHSLKCPQADLRRLRSHRRRRRHHLDCPFFPRSLLRLLLLRRRLHRLLVQLHHRLLRRIWRRTLKTLLFWTQRCCRRELRAVGVAMQAANSAAKAAPRTARLN